MDDKANVSYLTIGGYVEVNKYRFLYFFVILALYLVIIFCNSAIVYLIWAHQNLHQPMYIFIAALSLNSVFFSTAIYPKFLTDFLSEQQTISYQACLFQFFLFYSFGGADFLLLAAMAFDRYVAICKPLLYSAIMRGRTVCVLLFLAWFLSAFQVAISALLCAMEKLCYFTVRGVICNNSIFKLQCMSSSVISIYGLIVMLNIAVLPVLFIIFTYIKILLVSYQSSTDVRKKVADTCVPHLLVLISFSVLCVYDVVITRLEPNFPKIVHLLMTLQVVLYNPLLNSVIYGIKMKEISKLITKLCCFFKLS